MIELLKPLAAFARTVETGSFRAAAASLGVSPSVVSQHVTDLETRLGVALVYRSTRRLSLTHDGERLFEAARAMLDAATRGLDDLAGRAAAPTGRLTVTAPAVLGAGPLAGALAAFARAHPGVDLELIFSDVRRDIVAEGIDLAIRLGWLEDSALKARRLCEEPRVLIASPTYLAGRPAPRRPADLAGFDWIRLRSRPPKVQLTHADGEVVEVEGRKRLGVDDAASLHRFAREGLGVAAVLRFLAEDDLASGRLVEVLPDWRLAAPGLYAVWPPNAPRRGLTALLVDFLDERLRDRRA